VLAAGAAARFGGPKLLATLEGRPLAAWVAAAVGEAIRAGTLAGAVAVVPPAADPLMRIFRAAGLEAVTNPDPGRGIGASLALGIEALSARAIRPPAGAAVVMLADQPRLRAEVIGRLVAAWRDRGRSTRPRYAAAPGEPGHPVVLDRALWPLAATAPGDRGLGPVLQGRPEVVIVEVDGGNPDVDTPEDLLQIEGLG
jgi:molybdenum cofactor cytidylyltransferase